jgi:hypothetical protein
LMTSIRPCLSLSEVAGFRSLVLLCASRGCRTISRFFISLRICVSINPLQASHSLSGF